MTIIITKLLGGLGIFIYGMKIMSESMQNVAGDKLRTMLANLTKNRFMGVLTGMTTTIAIQSSSATTVMVVGFVNVGLLTLIEAIGVIMGANIGTTVTAWIVSILFKVNMSVIAGPTVIAGLFMSFNKSEKVKHWGMVLIGFSMIFIALGLLKQAIPSDLTSTKTLEQKQAIMNTYGWLKELPSSGLSSIFTFIGLGASLTVVLQSSSVTISLTLVFVSAGMIGFESGAAMVLGENIGTTITANLAALPGNRNAKKAALAHTFFNIIGVVWAALLFIPLLRLVDNIVPGMPGVSGLSNQAASETTRLHLSAFHTTFNLLNTFILIWFAKTMGNAVDKIVERFTKKDTSTFQHLSASSIATTPIALMELEAEVSSVTTEMATAFKDLEALIKEKYNQKSVDTLIQIERDLDQFKAQSNIYMIDLHGSNVSKIDAKEILAMTRAIASLEEVGDNLRRIGESIQKIKDIKKTLKHKTTLWSHAKIVKKHYKLVNTSLKDAWSENGKSLIDQSADLVSQSKHKSLKLHKEIANVKKKSDNLKASLYEFNISRHLLNISNSLHSLVKTVDTQRIY